jgi:hypothetical protein
MSEGKGEWIGFVVMGILVSRDGRNACLAKTARLFLHACQAGGFFLLLTAG